MISSRLLVVTMITLFAVAMRFLPHPPNFAPVAALALFAGSLCRSKKIGLLIPVIAMLVSDWMLGFHSLMLVVYGCLIFNVVIGQYWIGQSGRQPSKLVAASVIGSCLFFCATNFACWLSFYEPNLNGFISCYTLALPFFRNTLLSDLTYTTLFFGAVALAKSTLPVRHRSTLAMDA
ncbi:MAG: hypothetical protein P8N76_23200 [Pirellulaceae bacterium]|nr:hypothetical protein [Pirellulaceae bacterium]